MRYSHVERRSYRYAAVQFVSESHHHKPDAKPKPKPDYYPPLHLPYPWPSK